MTKDHFLFFYPHVIILLSNIKFGEVASFILLTNFWISGSKHLFLIVTSFNNW